MTAENKPQGPLARLLNVLAPLGLAGYFVLLVLNSRVQPGRLGTVLKDTPGARIALYAIPLAVFCLAWSARLLARRFPDAGPRFAAFAKAHPHRLNLTAIAVVFLLFALFRFLVGLA